MQKTITFTNNLNKSQTAKMALPMNDRSGSKSDISPDIECNECANFKKCKFVKTDWAKGKINIVNKKNHIKCEIVKRISCATVPKNVVVWVSTFVYLGEQQQHLVVNSSVVESKQEMIKQIQADIRDKNITEYIVKKK
jgi:hypothetical protein